MGAAMGSETTAAASGAVGVLRRDPMAMKPFCGYNFADYFAHWLSFDQPDAKLPRVFHVNWFRKGSDGRFLWPGFGDNLRVLDWVIRRCEQRTDAVETPIGLLPDARDLDLAGLDLAPTDLSELLHIDRAGWDRELTQLAEDFAAYGPRLPARLEHERRRVLAALNASASPRRAASG